MKPRNALICFFITVATTWPAAALWAKPKSADHGLDAEFVIQKESKQHRLFRAKKPLEQAPTAPAQAVSDPEGALKEHFPAPLAWQPVRTKVPVLKAQPPQTPVAYKNCVMAGLGNAFANHFSGHIQGGKLSQQAYTLHCLHNAVHLREEGKESTNLIALRIKCLRNLYRLSYGARYRSYDVVEPIQNRLYRRVRLGGVIDNHHLQLSKGTTRYRCSGRFRHLITPGQLRESQLKIHSSLEHPLDDTFVLQAASKLWLTKYAGGDQPHRNLLEFSPVLAFDIKSFRVRAGARLSAQTRPQQRHRDAMVLYPIAEISHQMHATLHPYVSLTGRTKPNFLHDLALENEAVVSDVSFLHTQQPWKIRAGSRGQWKQNRYDAGFVWQQQRDVPLFVQSAVNAGSFDVVYEPSMATSKFFAETVHNNTARTLYTRARAEWCHHHLEQEKKAWHLPSYRLYGQVSYTLQERVLMEGNVDWKGGLTTPTFERASSKPLDDWIDINLGVYYKWTTRLSLFVRGLNVLARSNKKYAERPWSGFRCILGLGYSW